MEIKTPKARYNLIEFNYYIDNSNKHPVHIVEFLLDPYVLENLETNLSNLFVVITESQSIVFSDYKISEYYYTDNNLLKIICIK